MTPSAAIVLAAGAGRRMGGPKALLVVDGQPLICAHVQRLREVFCRPIIVVTRPDVAAALGEIPGVQSISAETDSMAASLSVALRSLPLQRNRIVMVGPVDMLPARRSTLALLMAAATAEDTLVATPSHNSRSGHPIAIREELLQAFCKGYVGTLRDIVRSAGSKRRRVEVDDAAVTSDLNTPADLLALRPGLAPCFARVAGNMRWPDAGTVANARGMIARDARDC
jgi:molybdenum cofactor cytidylyltransferase